jgi:hypothetical protein
MSGGVVKRIFAEQQVAMRCQVVEVLSNGKYVVVSVSGQRRTVSGTGSYKKGQWLRVLGTTILDSAGVKGQYQTVEV